MCPCISSPIAPDAAAADCTHAPRAYLASEHERQGPVAADDLTLAHDRRETLEIPDRQRHQSGASQQTDSAEQGTMGPPPLIPEEAEGWGGGGGGGGRVREVGWSAET